MVQTTVPAVKQQGVMKEMEPLLRASVRSRVVEDHMHFDICQVPLVRPASLPTTQHALIVEAVRDLQSLCSRIVAGLTWSLNLLDGKPGLRRFVS